MPPPPGDDAFAPADYSLLAFLRRKLTGEPLPAAAVAHFHDADIYAADPATLMAAYRPAPEKNGEGGSCWFFFTYVRPKSASDNRKSRLVGGGVGTWHSERAPQRVLDDEGNCVGRGQYFSYKRKVSKKCSERSDWHMVEFSQDHGADHERLHGGEPQLVLSKIYKAHTCSLSRSAKKSASRQSSYKKRKANHCANLASAPLKAKRRHFELPAPISVAIPAPIRVAMSRDEVDEVRVVHLYNIVARILGSEETSLEELRSEGWLDRIVKEPAELSSQDKVSPSSCESIDTLLTPEVQALHSQVDDIRSFLMAASDEPPAPAHALCAASWIPSAFAEQDACNSTHSSLIPETQASVSSFLMNSGDAPPAPAHDLSSSSWIQDSAFSAEEVPCECIHSSWMAETEAPQVNTDSFLMAGDAPPAPAPAHCAPSSSFQSSSYWTSNCSTSSCSSSKLSDLGWILGVPTCDNELSCAVAGFTNKCSMPSYVLPQVTVAPSWWCSPDIQTC